MSDIIKEGSIEIQSASFIFKRSDNWLSIKEKKLEISENEFEFRKGKLLKEICIDINSKIEKLYPQNKKKILQIICGEEKLVLNGLDSQEISEWISAFELSKQTRNDCFIPQYDIINKLDGPFHDKKNTFIVKKSGKEEQFLVMKRETNLFDKDHQNFFEFSFQVYKIFPVEMKNKITNFLLSLKRKQKENLVLFKVPKFVIFEILKNFKLLEVFHNELKHPLLLEYFHFYHLGLYSCSISEFIPYGELFFHLQTNKHFSEETTLFFSCELILALNHLFENNILYYKLNPEKVNKNIKNNFFF